MKITQEIVDKIIELRSQRMDWGEISKKVGVSRPLIYYACRKYPELKEAMEYLPSAKYRKLTPELEEVVLEARSRGLGWKQCAEVAGVSWRNILYERKCDPIFDKNCREALPHRADALLTQEVRENIIGLRAKGMTWEEIADHEDLTSSTIYRARRMDKDFDDACDATSAFYGLKTTGGRRKINEGKV